MPTRRAFRLHLALGVWLGLPLSFVVATGTLATLSPELDPLFVPALVCDGTRAGQLEVGWGELARSARAAMPEARLHSLAAPARDDRCAVAVLEHPERTFHHVYLDPHDARVTGRSGYGTPQRLLRDLHRSLLLGENVGLTVVGLFAWILAGSLFTGLRSLGKLRRAITAGHGTRRAHRALAVLLAPFLSLVVITAGWYFVEHVAGLFELRATPIPVRADPAVAARLRDGEATLEVDALVARAREAYPEMTPTFVALAVPRRTYAVVTGPAGEPFVRDQASQVFLSPFDGEVLEVSRADALTPLQRWEHGVDFLHFGTFAGTASRWLYTVLGLAACALIATGTLGRWRRRRAAPESSGLGLG